MKKYNKYIIALTALMTIASISADDSSGSDALDMRDMKIDDYVAQSFTSKSALSQGLDAAQADKRAITADCKQSQKEVDARIKNLRKDLQKSKSKKTKTTTTKATKQTSSKKHMAKRKKSTTATAEAVNKIA